MNESVPENKCGGSLARRDKYWSELTADERIERMRQEVKRMDRLLSECYAELLQLRAHQHGPLGQMLFPRQDGYNLSTPPYRGRMNTSEEYF